MDLTTLGAALLFALGLLATDTVLHTGNIDLQVAGKIEGASLERTTTEAVLVDEIDRIGTVFSIMDAPKVHIGDDAGVGMALAEAANVRGVARALQRQFGYEPDRIRIAFYNEGGRNQALVAGGSARLAVKFEDVLPQNADEPAVEFIRRAALDGMYRMDPYFATLYQLVKHHADGKLAEAKACAEAAIASLPPTTVSVGRSAFQNILGLIALQERQPADARRWFEAAAASDPGNAVAQINAAFADLTLAEFARAAGRMEALLAHRRPRDSILLADAYAAWGAALAGEKQFAEADRKLELAVNANPDSSAHPFLWADIKEQLGFPRAAAVLRQRATDVTDLFENYSEMASLYFNHPWRGDGTLTASPFGNPTVTSFR